MVSGSELVACTNTRSVETTPVAVLQVSMAEDVAATVTLAAVHVPKMSPLIVLTASSPTVRAEVEAVAVTMRLVVLAVVAVMAVVEA